MNLAITTNLGNFTRITLKDFYFSRHNNVPYLGAIVEMPGDWGRDCAIYYPKRNSLRFSKGCILKASIKRNIKTQMKKIYTKLEKDIAILLK